MSDCLAEYSPEWMRQCGMSVLRLCPPNQTVRRGAAIRGRRHLPLSDRVRPHLRTLDIVQGQTLRWLVEVFIQDWKSYEGWSQLTKQPGVEGARNSAILSLLVDHALFVHPDQHAQLIHNLPAYTVGSLRAHVQVECLIDVVEHLVSSEAPQEQWHRFTPALHQVFAYGRSKKHMIQRQLGRLGPTTSLKYRADEVMRNMPALSS